jgi:hypothetical protein
VTSIRIPVICPICRAETLQHFDVASLAAALLRESPIALRVLCHPVRWNASSLEVDQIREYLQERRLLVSDPEDPRPGLAS